MSRKYIDEFVKLPISKMAQKISDMTYHYKNTEVPKAHYQKLLNQEVIEMLAQDSTMQLVLLNAVLGQLQALKKESPSLFLKALVCLEKGIKVESINNRIYDSLELTVSEYQKCNEILNNDIIVCYESAFEEHSLGDIDNTDDNNNNFMN